MSLPTGVCVPFIESCWSEHKKKERRRNLWKWDPYRCRSTTSGLTTFPFDIQTPFPRVTLVILHPGARILWFSLPQARPLLRAPSQNGPGGSESTRGFFLSLLLSSSFRCPPSLRFNGLLYIAEWNPAAPPKRTRRNEGRQEDEEKSNHRTMKREIWLLSSLSLAPVHCNGGIEISKEKSGHGRKEKKREEKKTVLRRKPLHGHAMRVLRWNTTIKKGNRMRGKPTDFRTEHSRQ